MIDFIIHLLVNAAVVYVASLLLPGVTIKNFLNAIFAAALIAVANVFIRPILEFLAFPITVITLGLFRLVITAIILMLVDWLLTGMKIKNFGWAILLGIVIAVINWVLSLFLPI